MLNGAHFDRPSERTILAAGLFARLVDAIDHGQFREASRARSRLAILGFLVSFRTRRPARRPEGGPPMKPQAESFPVPDRITYRLAELSKALGVSRRTLERERSAGRFPPPDLTIGKLPLWRVETVRRWVEGGGK